MARPMPVLPLVASMTVWPGLSSPDFSAASITPSARRSLTEPSGLKASILTKRLTPRRSQPVDADNRRIADRLQDALELTHRRFSFLRVRTRSAFSETRQDRCAPDRQVRSASSRRSGSRRRCPPSSYCLTALCKVTCDPLFIYGGRRATEHGVGVLRANCISLSFFTTRPTQIVPGESEMAYSSPSTQRSPSCTQAARNCVACMLGFPTFAR